ncbi:hypothetical protein L1987_22557 [Smallanthus sonchifolius]|uniref:Uncharacterized protein n=1 Tax=Smallanthus sonchifolius TaxID=185202 RepID=A0ACB9IGX1_9ASTR|nr:hypothetical protein L1987_22557 [Smallanthus sonchifolius]
MVPEVETLEPETVEEKKQHRLNRNQEVWEEKGKTPNVDDLSLSDSVSVAAAVKEISVTNVSNIRWEGGICTKLTSLNLLVSL